MKLHHYQGALLSNIWLESGFARHETKWGAGTSYCDLDGLFRAITIELCLSPNQLTGESVRFLRHRLEMTQGQLGKELDCSGQAVAKWEKGAVASIPGAPARMLRLLALKSVAPQIRLDEAVADYNQPPLEMLVFRYSESHGWSSDMQASIKSRHTQESFKRIFDWFQIDGRASQVLQSSVSLDKFSEPVESERHLAQMTMKIEPRPNLNSAEAIRNAFDKCTGQLQKKSVKKECVVPLKSTKYQHAA